MSDEIKLPKVHSLKAYCYGRFHDGHNESKETPLTTDGYFLTKDETKAIIEALEVYANKEHYQVERDTDSTTITMDWPGERYPDHLDCNEPWALAAEALEKIK